MDYPVVTLHPGRERAVLRRHQWIFSNAIRKMGQGIQSGDLVAVTDIRGNVLATGHYQDSSLSIRILCFGPARIDNDFWKDKLRTALEMRQALGLPGDMTTNAFRLVHGEGDELPGLIVDIYDHVAVFQAHSIGMYRHRHEIAAELMALPELSLRAVFDRSIATDQEETTAGAGNPWLAGSTENVVEIREHGIPFRVEFTTGQKTGFFLDQRDNRQLLRSFTDRKSVLNLFCYTGGFTLNALAGGATRVVSVDSSAQAIALLEHHVHAFRPEASHKSICTDVMSYLSGSDEEFDIIICDPPAFAKSMHKRHNAIQAYKRLNTLAMKKVAPGGMLFTFSCSQVVDRQLFYDTIVAAAIEADRPVRVLYELSQGPDHPVSLFHPEGQYLKGLILYIEK